MPRIGIQQILGTVLVLLVLGCSNRPVPLYSYFYKVPSAEWHETQEYFFPVPVSDQSDTTVHYQVTGVLRLVPGYSLQKLPIGIVYESPDHHITTSSVTILLEEILEQKGGYNISEVFFTIDSLRSFPHSGVYTYSFRHLLTDSIARGVREVGIWIEPRP